jgi:hypothetical protein
MACDNQRGGIGSSKQSSRTRAIFFLQQALLYPGADNYRVLGLSPGATLNDIKDHKRLLLKWLHPDRNSSSWEQLLFQRVATAATDLEQGVVRRSSSTTIANNSRRHSNLRTKRNISAIRHKSEDKFRNYLRRAVIAFIVFILGASAWRLVFADPSAATLGWLSW